MILCRSIVVRASMTGETAIKFAAYLNDEMLKLAKDMSPEYTVLLTGVSAFMVSVGVYPTG